ncbi:probable WRKY transcription factor 27 isoform X1 [Fagus crenata]
MADDWDLYAVVRSCKYTATKNNTTTTTTTTTTTNTATSEDPLPCLASLTVKEESDPFSFPHLVEPKTNGFQELQQLCKPFFPTTTTSYDGIKPNSSISDIQQRRHPVRSVTTTGAIMSHFNPGSSSTGFRGILDQQRPQVRQHAQQLQPNQSHQIRQVHQQEFQKPQAISDLSLPTMQSQSQSQVPRSRKRKNQQKRTVRHVTAENLLADVWAWRKYGQKPIKGSPYPRNYYRCSSSKGCIARKQVERSNTEPNIFIITYTGEHTHPRPTHRNSLAGSVRNKFSASNNSISDTNNIASCSSPQSATCLSPTTPLTEAVNDHQQNINEEINKKESQELMDDNDEVEVEEEENEDDILIPNIAMNVNDDIFMGLQELGFSPGGGGSGDNFSTDNRGGANSSSSWPPCSSAAAVGGC